jgi:hypothetical protein
MLDHQFYYLTQWAKTGWYADGPGAVGGIRTSEGSGEIAASNGDNRGFVAKGQDNVGNDDKVYKRHQNGNWSQGSGNGWLSVPQEDVQAKKNQAQQKSTKAPARNRSQRMHRPHNNLALPASLEKSIPPASKQEPHNQIKPSSSPKSKVPALPQRQTRTHSTASIATPALANRARNALSNTIPGAIAPLLPTCQWRLAHGQRS